MKSRKILLSIIVFLFFISLTGCSDIKFIEKIDSDKSSVSETMTETLTDTLDYGEIITTVSDSETVSDNIPSFLNIVDENDDFSETETSIVPYVSSDSYSTGEIPGNILTSKTINGILFEIKEEKETMYIIENCILYYSPDLNSKYITVNKNQKIIIISISDNKKWAEISCNDSIYYINEPKLSDKPAPETTVTTTVSLPSTTTDTNSLSTTTTTVPYVVSTEPVYTSPSVYTEPPVTDPIETNYSEAYIPPDTEPITIHSKANKNRIIGGIEFPDDISKTSIVFGVTFINMNLSVETVNDVDIISGPGEVSDFTGYIVLDWAEAGTTFTATGISFNGWVRVKDENGKIGFIYNEDLTPLN